MDLVKRSLVYCGLTLSSHGGVGGSTCRQQRKAMTKQTKDSDKDHLYRGRGTKVRTSKCRTDNVTQVTKSRGDKKGGETETGSKAQKI